jgi:anthranilate synthase component I
MKFKFNTVYKKIISDMLTPVSIYLRLRERFPGTILLESSDYHGDEHNYSYICFDPIAGFKVENNIFVAGYPDNTVSSANLDELKLIDCISDFIAEFSNYQIFKSGIIHNGLFGYMAYDAVQHFEDIRFRNSDTPIPIIQYHAYRYIIAVNHFNNELYIFKHDVEGCGITGPAIDEIESMIKYSPLHLDHFQAVPEKRSNYTNAEFMANVNKGKEHCYRGDVFQIVLSRKYEQDFSGDDFNVYRALRSINPSPYCFYFDFGDFRLMGSSPESQLIIRGMT